MRDVLERYLSWMEEQQYSAATVAQYRCRLRQYLAWLGEREHTQRTLIEYREYLQRERGLSAKSIHVAYCALTQWRKWMMEVGEEERAGPDPTRVKLPREGVPQRRTPTEEEVQAIWQAARRLPEHTTHARFRKARNLAILALLTFTTLRRCAILGLEVQDVRHGRDAQGWSVRVRWDKGGQQRIVPLNPAAVPFVEQWLAVREAWATDHGYAGSAMWPVDRVRRLSDTGFETLWREIITAAGLWTEERGIAARILPHGFRHFAASDMLAHTGDLCAVQEVLGHRSLRTTQRYLHASPSRIQRAAQSQPDYTGPPPGSRSPEAGADTPAPGRSPSSLRNPSRKPTVAPGKDSTLRAGRKLHRRASR
jgi:site-specific recombinase XerD